MSQLEQYAKLASVLQEMEKDLGLQGMSVAEKAILSALTNLHQSEKGDGFIASKKYGRMICVKIYRTRLFFGLCQLWSNRVI